jgi:hypothetical protein
MLQSDSMRTALVTTCLSFGMVAGCADHDEPGTAGDSADGHGADGSSMGSTQPGGETGALGYLHQDGLGLVDGRGDPVTLHGVNLGGWLMWEGWIWGGIVADGGSNAETAVYDSLVTLVGDADAATFRQSVYDRFITEADIARIAELGYDSVRVPFNHRLLEDDAAPYVYRDAGWTVLDRLLDWCEAHEVYAVLDMHAAPGGQSDVFVSDPDATNLWEDLENQNRTVALWRAIAERYQDRRWLAGYDLLNEPQVLLGQQLVDLYGRITDAIREVDDHHVVFLEGNWSAVIFDPFTEKLDDNLAYSLHQYAFSGRDLDADLASAVSLAQAQQVPLWAGEYGEDTASQVAARTDVYRRTPEIAGWATWTWKRTDTGNPVPQQIVPPAAWSAVMLWITAKGSFPQPTAEQTRAAMAEFLDAVDLSRCTEDAAFVAATL